MWQADPVTYLIKRIVESVVEFEAGPNDSPAFLNDSLDFKPQPLGLHAATTSSCEPQLQLCSGQWYSSPVLIFLYILLASRGKALWVLRTIECAFQIFTSINQVPPGRRRQARCPTSTRLPYYRPRNPVSTPRNPSLRLQDLHPETVLSARTRLTTSLTLVPLARNPLRVSISSQKSHQLLFQIFLNGLSSVHLTSDMTTSR